MWAEVKVKLIIIRFTVWTLDIAALELLFSLLSFLKTFLRILFAKCGHWCPLRSALYVVLASLESLSVTGTLLNLAGRLSEKFSYAQNMANCTSLPQTPTHKLNQVSAVQVLNAKSLFIM